MEGLDLNFLIALITVVSIAIAWLLPIIMIVASDEIATSERLAWILAVIFISWFAWVFFFLLAPIKKKE